ncbi:MAG: hypothetical protein ACXABY_00250 [Candidatus Thorarchaeota archaeon]|jgi:hypothetical protein
MATTKYYTVVFLNAGSPATGLTPSIDTFKDIATDTNLTPIPPVSEVANGIYKFLIDWTDSDYDGVDEIVSRVDGGSGLSDEDRYIYGVARRNDFLDAYELMDAQVLGNWIVSNDQLKIYTDDGALLRTFDLTDINGNPTNTAATSRTKV